MAIGRNFHIFADRFFNWVSRKKLTQLATVDDVKQYFYESLSGVEPKYLYRLCRNFLDFEAEQWFWLGRDWGKWMPLLREHWIEFRIGEVEFRLKVDRVDYVKKGCLRVVEYKIHKPPLTAARRETCLYALALNYTKELPYPVRRWGLYAAAENTWLEAPLHVNTVNALKRWVEKFLLAQAANHYPKRIGDHCAYCPFLGRCLEDEG